MKSGFVCVAATVHLTALLPSLKAASDTNMHISFLGEEMRGLGADLRN